MIHHFLLPERGVSVSVGVVSKQKFNITLKELHNDSNIRFLINEYYKECVK